MTLIDTCGARLNALLKRALADPLMDRSAITQAAVALMDATARACEDDDEAVTALADRFAEQAALWAYFDRPADCLRLRNAMRGYEMAAAAVAADIYYQ